jgi:hypothetical protein
LDLSKAYEAAEGALDVHYMEPHAGGGKEAVDAALPEILDALADSLQIERWSSDSIRIQTRNGVSFMWTDAVYENAVMVLRTKAHDLRAE